MSQDYFVLGGAGAMGRVTVRDLFEFAPRSRIIVADFNEAAARDYAASFKSPRVTAQFADARRPPDLAPLLAECPLVINCTQHDFNLSVMEAALQARVHYMDLGGLFVWTRKQLKLHGRFRKAGLMAVLGMGGSPGITNIMVRHAADRLERVEAIRVRSGWASFGPPDSELSFGFSAQTILEELTLPAFIYSNGRFRTVKPRTRWERVAFSRPVGPSWCLCTRHSEVATLADSFRDKGCRYCDFKLGYDRAFVRAVVEKLEQGWTLQDFKKLPASRERVDDCEILRIRVKGRTPAGEKTETIMDCTSRSNARWKASAGDINTGCPPSIAAQMLVDGRLPVVPGVWGPECVVPPRPFFAELKKRGMQVVKRPAPRASRGAR